MSPVNILLNAQKRLFMATTANISVVMTTGMPTTRLSRLHFSTATADDLATVPPKPPRPTAAELAEFAKRIPIEKQSLARGMSINEFEKDFIIYPEYEHSLEQERIKDFVQKLEGDLQIAYDQLRAETATQELGTLPAKVQLVLAKHNVFAAAVPNEFGGKDFCQKDLLQLNECLGNRDLNLLSTFNAFSLATSLITQYGTTEQKEHYLRGIAEGKWRPAVCIEDESTGPQAINQVFYAKGQQQQFLSAIKTNVENAYNANLFIVFANRKVGEVILPACYLVERDAVMDAAVSSIKVGNQLKTGGLQRCNFSTVVFENVPLRDWMLLGSCDNAGYLTDELTVVGKIAYGAGVVGHLKKVIGDLCHFANQQITGNLRLADSHPIQRSLTELGIITYVLESVVYYVAGMIDEELFLMQDIENAIVQRLCNRALRQSITTIAEVSGFVATNTEMCFEQPMRDAIAMLSRSEPDLHLIRRISIPPMETYVNKFGGMAKFRDSFATEKLFKIKLAKINEQDFLSPALIHFIAEQVHPSLEPAAHSLEYSMSRLGQLFDRVCTVKGALVNTDYVTLGNVCFVMENLLAMTATIARSSRSYAIGLRGAENELQWTIMFCMKASEDTKNIILDNLDNESYVRMNPRLTDVGQGMLQYNGYFPECPLEKNW